MRVGVGAAIILLITALVAAVLISAFSQPVSRRIDAGFSGAGSLPTAGSSGGGFATTSPTVAGTATHLPTILVHVLGAVRKPGLFELPTGARVMDAIVHAGGLDATADPAGVNLARPLSDGEQLYVPHVGEVVPFGVAGPVAGAPSGAGAPGAAGAATKININTAAVADLDTLPHVGPMMAQRIVDYRTANGPFSRVEDLRNVTGIGDKTYESLKDLIVV